MQGDDLGRRAQFAKDLAAHLNAASGRFHALEGTILGKNDVVVGVKFARLDALDHLVAQLR